MASTGRCLAFDASQWVGLLTAARRRARFGVRLIKQDISARTPGSLTGSLSVLSHTVLRGWLARPPARPPASSLSPGRAALRSLSRAHLRPDSSARSRGLSGARTLGVTRSPNNVLSTSRLPSPAFSPSLSPVDLYPVVFPSLVILYTLSQH